jgi:uncharacterized OB-fold protein
MQEYRKPLPILDEDAKPFWEAAKRHELVLLRCRICGEYAPVQFPIGGNGCLDHGFENMEWVKVSGKGTVFTFVVFHMSFNPAFKEDVPYGVAMIELEEGPLLLSNVVDCKPEDLKIGMPVEVIFEDVTEEETLPKFKPMG